ncbi:MAG: dTMP kinase [Cetobacterium sp.]|uniref:dTMP kinase n=1 Tax=Cetobacterium sp. TaxID=2071632 RepID=UPI003F312A19
MKRIIVIEGTDGAGKETQTKLLHEKLLEKSKNVFYQSFPNYDNRSAEPVRVYLEGETGGITSLTPKAASTLFAVDRLLTWKTDLAKLNDVEDYTLICDRYTTSNMLYQATKFDTVIDSVGMIDWISKLEYVDMEIPKPNLVIFLDMPPWATRQLRKDRLNKMNGAEVQDIHESNESFLVRVYDLSKRIALREGWKIIKCTEDGNKIKSIDEIHQEILKVVE